ncbi:MAG TPA: hypothetical protein DEB40_04825 [Elusimicrobia bacterium]|nr:hypothetical protein [Elusimicrobiota bacterium]HBT61047.1 hypothetical protein [Elusimicrobiota bacterium]
MADPFRRLHARYPCDVPVTILSFLGNARLAEGRLVNLGVGGALLDCARPLEKKVPYLLRFPANISSLSLPGRVVWIAPRNPQNPQFHRYGVQFNLTSSQERILRALVERLRRALEQPEQPDFLRDYWNH